MISIAELITGTSTTDSEIDTSALEVESVYATIAVPTVDVSAKRSFDEEAIYTAFEQALSGRFEVLQSKLQHSSRLNLSTYSVAKSKATSFRLPRYIVMGLFALSFLMLGFDFMGLLVILYH